MFDAFSLAIAFVFGFAARQLGLPPLVGFLIAGFVLNAMGAGSGAVLERLADIGVTLLLFTIGLKLRVRTLIRPQVWAVASIHMALVSLVVTVALMALALTGLSLFADLTPVTALLVAFALSYSSTVFAVKVLEEKGEQASVYGRIAVGILIIQDIAAVAFLASTTGKMPTPWALALVAALWPLRWLLARAMERAGHGELLVLFGLTVAMGGALVFEGVGIKGDLGAIILGALLAGQPGAGTLAKSLLSLKDLFLVGFFLSIGLEGSPDPETLVAALLLVLLMPFKSVLYFWLLARFHLRARTALLSSLALSNYSEFGLIVAAVATTAGWLDPSWLTVIAIALSLSFIAAAPLNARSHRLYEWLGDRLLRFQRPGRLPDEEEIDPGEATVIVLGMGRVGTGAYDALKSRRGERVVGVDLAPEVIDRHQEAGRLAIRGSATDPDFWSRLKLDGGSVRLVLLAMPQLDENIMAARELTRRGYTGRIAALAKFDGDIGTLRDAGVHRVYNLYAEAGAGLADDAYE